MWSLGLDPSGKQYYYGDRGLDAWLLQADLHILN